MRVKFDLPTPKELDEMSEYAIVGYLQRAETERFHHYRNVRNQVESLEPVNEQDEAEFALITIWIMNAQRFAPKWYVPDYAMRVDQTLSALYTEVADELNDVITKRREVEDLADAGQSVGEVRAILPGIGLFSLRGEQTAYERCRLKILGTVQNLVWHYGKWDEK